MFFWFGSKFVSLLWNIKAKSFLFRLKRKLSAQLLKSEKHTSFGIFQSLQKLFLLSSEGSIAPIRKNFFLPQVEKIAPACVQG
ncbi:Uncharacterized protein AMR50_0023 [Leptospira interrogans]|nr:Uncharacterized protein AMR50_0023 [Leptospira interrogans]